MKTRDEKKEDYRNEGSIMQLKITTDYAVRIVYYLALRKETVTAAQLSEALKIPESYIPKITKRLKDANIITACEGIKGGYLLSENQENISLFDIISSTEVTMKINRCLEKDGFCSRKATDYCSVHKAFLKVQKIYEDSLRAVRISDMI